MKVDIQCPEQSDYGNPIDLTTIEFTNKDITTLWELQTIICAICANYCFEPNVVLTQEFKDWFNAIDPTKRKKTYRIICGHLDDNYIVQWK